MEILLLIISMIISMYVNLGKNLSTNINTVSNRAPESYISLCNKNFEPVSEDEIVKIVLQMKNSSPGLDGITAKILKQSCHQILKPLSHVLNLSLLNGCFPEELKVAQVVPIFKTGDPTKFINYRPVSLLSVFSKFYVHVVHTRLLSFIKQHDILYKYQFGFREKCSTSSALTTLVDHILNYGEKGDYVIAFIS